MALAADLRFELLADTDISDIIGTNLYPIVDSSKNKPTMVYNLRSGIPEVGMSGNTHLTSTDVQLDFYTDEYADIDVIRQRVIEIFHNKQIVIGENDTTSIVQSYVTNTLETLDTSDGETLRLLIELTILT